MVSGGAEAKFKVMSVKASRPVTAGSRMTTSNDGDILPDSKTGSYVCMYHQDGQDKRVR